MSDNFKPLVSIVIPVYNGSNYMREAIDSALNQTYQNIEVLVINDGSSDEGKTREIALSYGDKIRYFEKENGGVSTALNLGIREMKGDYFSWLSHDDVYYENKISIQINKITKLVNKNVIIFSNYNYINEKSIVISKYKVKGIFKNSLQFVLLGMINGITLLIPKICFKKMGNFNLELKTTQDYFLWFILAKEYKFLHLKDFLAASRVHEEQGSVKEDAFSQERIKLYTFFVNNLDLGIIFTKEYNLLFYYQFLSFLNKSGLRKVYYFMLNKSKKGNKIVLYLLNICSLLIIFCKKLKRSIF